MRRIAYELPAVGMDVVELAPPNDEADITAFLANRVVLEVLSGVARRRRDAADMVVVWRVVATARRSSSRLVRGRRAWARLVSQCNLGRNPRQLDRSPDLQLHHRLLTRLDRSCRSAAGNVERWAYSGAPAWNPHLQDSGLCP